MERIIRARYSCRSFSKNQLSKADRSSVDRYLATKITGPFGSGAKFSLVAAGTSDSDELKGLGTYGFIRNPAAFIIGVIKVGDMNLEDFGYSMEMIILHATEMGLGTCWLGGTFKRSSFAAKAGLAEDELIPAVAAVGYPAGKKTVTDRIVRATAGSDKRKKNGELFYNDDITELDTDFENGYGKALAMVRIAPSASNKQPWRIVKERGAERYHFFLDRTPGYNRKTMKYGMTDLQRIDMGIAMCHFETVAVESGLRGKWTVDNPADIKTPAGWEYSITWNGAQL